MSVKNYSADQVSFVFAGIPFQEGLADGDFIKITENDERYKVQQGTDGSVTRSKHLGRLTTVELHLMQTSASNSVLSAIHNQDYLTNNGSGIAPLAIVDRNGTSLYACQEAWIAKPPERTYSREAGPRVWTFMCKDMNAFDGGNS
jgi:hypothetical protein